MARLRRIDFRLLTCLLLAAAAALQFSWFAYAAERQRATLEYLAGKCDGYEFAYFFDDQLYGRSAPSFARRAIADILGEDFACSVTTLYCKCDGLTDDDVRRLCQFQKLEELDLDSSTITTEAIDSLLQLPRLESLVIHCHDQIGNQGLSKLARMKSLKFLSLADVDFNCVDLTALHRCGQLCELVLSPRQSASESDTIPEDVLIPLRQLENLKMLRLVDMDCNDRMISQLASLENLEQLSISGAKMTDACVDDLLAMRHLKTLDIVGAKLSPENLERLNGRIANCRVLEVPASPYPPTGVIGPAETGSAYGYSTSVAAADPADLVPVECFLTGPEPAPRSLVERLFPFSALWQ